MSLLTPRTYQREAVDAAVAAWRRGLQRPAEVLFTGAGKTVVFALLGTEWLADNPGRRVLVLVHTQELLDQAIAKWRSVAPGLRVGAVQAQRNETLAQVIVATVQTLRSDRRRAMLRNVGLVIVDECHHAVAVTYRSVMGHFGCFGQENRSGGDRAVAIGYTATMVRGDGLALGDVWQEIVYTRSIAEGIADGFLVRPRGLHVQVDDLDLSRVRMQGGDYRSGELGEAVETSMAPQAVAKAVAEHAPERKTVLFAPTVSSAAVLGDALRASGREVWLVHGAMPVGERRAALDGFRASSGGVLTNCLVASEGFDEPAIDCIVIARPTKSAGLYIQMVGRGLRPWPGKSEALVLDVVGATREHSLLGAIELFGEEAKPKEPKELPEDWDEDEDELDEGQQDARLLLNGPLVATEIDLFAASGMRWLRTRAGVFFLPAGERYIAILPARPGSPEQWMAHFAGRGTFGYDVIEMHKDRLHTEKPIHSGVADLSYAMAWAEQAVTPAEKTTAAKERSWQARPPTPKMRAFAERLQIFVPPGARMGEISNLITLALASKRIDPYIPNYARGVTR